MVTIPFKRGDTFLLRATASQASVDFTGWSARCQIREMDQPDLIAEAVVTTVSNASGSWVFDIRVNDTSTWPVGKLRADIQYTSSSGDVVSTETFVVNCVEDVTR